MKRLVYLLAVMFTTYAASQSAMAQDVPIDSVLEEYIIGHGGTLGGPSGGINAVLLDDFLGNGDAKALARLDTRENPGTLTLRVWRKVKRGDFTFALLVFRVEIRGFDAAGEPIYQHELGGFTFGDSASGNWTRTLRNIPEDIRRLQITFVGNYE